MISPEQLTRVPGYDIAGVYKPGRHDEEVGGDFYDCFPIDGDLYGILIGDVLGKGKEAAVSAAMLRYSTRSLMGQRLSPSQVVESLNRLIESQKLRFGTASLFVGILNAKTCALCYCNAGHEPPLLKRENGMEETLAATALLVGVGIEAPTEEGSTVLYQGDALLLITDGATEARNDDGRFLEADGMWRLFRKALRRSSTKSALAFIDTALSSFIGNNSRDDIAIILLRRLETDSAA